jgi:hypothetical protein
LKKGSASLRRQLRDVAAAHLGLEHVVGLVASSTVIARTASLPSSSSVQPVSNTAVRARVLMGMRGRPIRAPRCAQAGSARPSAE